jgi:hypothetical protein
MAGQEQVEARWAEQLRRVERWHNREKKAPTPFERQP